MKITKVDLKKSKQENVIRLARWLRLRIDGMSIRQIINLIYWRITRDDHKYQIARAKTYNRAWMI
jgi:hypothetical protein